MSVRIGREETLSSRGLLRLSCAVQTYDWGKPGRSSTVAQLKACESNCFAIQEDQNYAELWMGTHPSGPSRVQAEVREPYLLRDYLAEHPEAMGSIKGESAGDLPFMFKVLSINKALSIQAHPDKKLAEQLHHDRPDTYKDSNHKPEMAISLSDFEALCGFRPLEEIAQHIREYAELRALISDEACTLLDSLPNSEQERKAALKAVFSSYMSASDDLCRRQIDALIARLRAAKQLSPLQSLLLRIHRDYPGDTGLFGPLFLNYVCLGPGKAFVMHANEPHAYLRGDILESMACSDNVVRVGLTPKYKDVPTLLSMLTYRSGHVKVEDGDILDSRGRHRRFTPGNIEEFEVETIELVCEESICFLPIDSPSILLVLKGEGQGRCPELEQERISLSRGMVYFVAANTALELEGSGQETFHVAIAHSNLAKSRR